MYSISKLQANILVTNTNVMKKKYCVKHGVFFF